jgi:hypothetical protein
VKYLMIALAILMASPAAASQVQEDIKARCSDKWGDDFRMQKYCRDKQASAFLWVAEWSNEHVHKKPETFRHKILVGCGTRWKDKFGYDWPMFKYCIQKQEEAYKQLSDEPWSGHVTPVRATTPRSDALGWPPGCPPQ